MFPRTGNKKKKKTRVEDLNVTRRGGVCKFLKYCALFSLSPYPTKENNDAFTGGENRKEGDEVKDLKVKSRVVCRSLKHCGRSSLPFYYIKGGKNDTFSGRLNKRKREKWRIVKKKKKTL